MTSSVTCQGGRSAKRTTDSVFESVPTVLRARFRVVERPSTSITNRTTRGMALWPTTLTITMPFCRVTFMATALDDAVMDLSCADACEAIAATPAAATPMSAGRSEEHTSELQSLMRISYAVFCLQKKKKK